MECEKCQDKGFEEKNHGLLMVLCDCKAGEAKRVELIGESDGDPKYLIIPQVLPGKTISETADVARKIIKSSKENDDSNSGTQPDNQSTGSPDTGQPKQPKKPKAKRKARKGNR